MWPSGCDHVQVSSGQVSSWSRKRGYLQLPCPPSPQQRSGFRGRQVEALVWSLGRSEDNTSPVSSCLRTVPSTGLTTNQRNVLTPSQL